ncbi:MAG: ribosome small subunit-dependent GTPase A [Caulobacteraceae bacterium]
MIDQYGWSDALARQFNLSYPAGFVPGRVIVQQRGLWTLVTHKGECTAELSGRLGLEAASGGYPVVGDWVALNQASEGERAVIHHVLPRRTAFVRRAAGPAGGEQVVAANADLAFLTASLNADLNPRRLERYLAAAWQSGAKPVIVLTKADLCPDVGAAASEAQGLAIDTPVIAVSAVSGEGLDDLRGHLEPGRTAVLLGSSGVGKSTLVNALLGVPRMATGAVRADDERGRHTTSHRELILLPSGGLLLDTPGMRELGLWDSEEGLSAAFEDVEALAARCRFSDCGHTSEPGCAVRTALESGLLDANRWKSYGKLQRELAHLESRDNPALRAARRRRWVQINKANRTKSRGRSADQG